MSTRKNKRTRGVGSGPELTVRSATDEQAGELAAALHALGDYAHVDVGAERGALNIYPDDGKPVARLTPLGGGQYGLSFHNHTGKWEQMPFAGKLTQMADTIDTPLGMFVP